MKIQMMSAALSLMLAVSAHAATVVNNYAEAKEAAGDDGFVVVVYPDGWNAKDEAIGKGLLESAEVQKAAGNAAMIGLALSNNGGKEEQEKNKQLLGPISVPNANSYPAIVLCEPSGRNYAIVSADQFCAHAPKVEDAVKGSLAPAAKAVAERMAALKQQRALMEKAKAATGKNKIDLIAEACRIPGINRPDKVTDLVKQADPGDEFGLNEALTHNMYGYIEGCARTDDWKARLEDIEKKLKNPYFPPEIKQTLYTSAIGMMRRKGGAAYREKMLQYMEEMKQLAPESVYGASYDGATRLWSAWQVGWTPDTVPADNGPMVYEVPYLKPAGVYTVKFNYSRGSHAFQASGVALYDGDKKVAEDLHKCFTGYKSEGNEYTLRVPADVAHPVLRVLNCMGNNRNTYGTMSISRN